MRARLLRTGLRATNVALAIGIAALGVVAVVSGVSRLSAGASGSRGSPLASPRAVVPSSTLSAAEFARFGATLGGSRERDAVRVAKSSVTDDPTGPLPLRLFRVSCLYHDPTGIDVVGLASKDPAHPESFAVGRDEVVHGVRLVSVERGTGPARITVERGVERFTYSFSRPTDDAIDLSRIVRGAPLAVGSKPIDAKCASATRATLPEDAGVRFVSYLGSNGEASGIRVTGLGPTSAFATAGVRRGDVILEFDGRRIASAADFSMKWNDGWRPKDALLLSLDQPGGKPTRIKFGS